MRTLLIDNYDSYTYILGHYIWKISGEQPIVIKNDAMCIEEIRQLKFDSIVISPGPGRPEKIGDFGVCTQVLEAFRSVPVLGVCLGHQGIGAFSGAKICHAPAVKHGKLSQIIHDGTGLFKDIPNRFRAVRYHSLVIDPMSLSDNVLVTATAADDGQIMAITLKDRPYYGVQFHPESIGTEHGERLLKNFLCGSSDWIYEGKLTCGNQPAHRTCFKKTEWKEPLEVFRALYGAAPMAFWLDSSFEGENARYSYMGAAEEVFEITGRNCAHKVWDSVLGRLQTDKEETGEPFELLRRLCKAQGVDHMGYPCEFPGGLVGCFTYEFGDKFHVKESSGSGRPVFPDASLLKANQFLAFDHRERVVYICDVHRFPGAASSKWLEEAGQLLQNIPVSENEGEAPLYSGKDGHGNDDMAGFIPSQSKTEYMAAIGAIKKLIRDGETYEVCLTNEFTLESHIAPFTLYQFLRKVNPAPYSAYLKLEAGTVLCSSPESFLKLRSDGSVKTEPMKGTRRKTADAELNLRMREELLSSEKENAELLMITDLLRNDMARVCRPGSIAVKEVKKVTEYATVLQQTSTITGQLREECGAADLMEACFPGGSITGAPKVRTMSIISSFEKRRRGVYTGSIGYLGYDGSLDLNIAIRTIVTDGKTICLGAGGAIVDDSDPEKEYEEIMIKAAPLFKAVRLYLNGLGREGAERCYDTILKVPKKW